MICSFQVYNLQTMVKEDTTEKQIRMRAEAKAYFKLASQEYEEIAEIMLSLIPESLYKET